MPCKQGDFADGVRIVEPDTNPAGHCQSSAVRRIGHRPVARTDAAFAQAGERTFGQIQAGKWLVLGVNGRHEQDAGQQGNAGPQRLFHLR